MSNHKTKTTMKKQIMFLISALLMCIALPSQNINTCAGTGSPPWNGDNILAVSANVGMPVAVAISPTNGDMYIASANRIRKIATTGIITTVAGDGTAGFTGDGGQATLARISDPRGLTIDAAGNLYIADNGNRRVRKIDPSGIITTYAGGGTGGDGVAATTASLMSVQDVAIDPAGNLYIAEGLKRKIRRVIPSGTIQTYAGTGVAGSTGDGGIAMFCTFMRPIGLTIDGTGNLYIADTLAFKVRMITTSSIVSTFAGSGLNSYSGNGGVATAAAMNGPTKLCCKGNTVYISDCANKMVRQVSSGIITAYSGTNTPGFSGDGGLPLFALLDNPQGLAVDNYGNVVICDSYNNRVRLVGCNKPVISASSSTASLCIGNQATLTATGGSNYTWTPGNMTGPVIAVSPTVNTTYTVNSPHYNCPVSTSTLTQVVMTCTTSTVTTGISENTTKAEVKAFPNPFQDRLTVNIDYDVKTIEIIDLNGRVVLKTDVRDVDTVELNTESISTGVYILQVTGDVVRTRKMIKF